MSWQWRMIENLKRNWLVVLKLTRRIWRVLTRAFERLKNLHFNGQLLTKVYNILMDWKVVGIWQIFTRALESLKIRTLTCAFKSMRNLANFHRLKNRDFVLESKMTELNQNKNSRQPDRQDAVWKLYFTLEISEKHY